MPGQDAEWSVAARAVALPRRWLVVGRRDGAEVLRVWTAEVADRLDVSPAPDLDGPGVDDDVELQDTARWMVDFDTAERSGMAVRIPAAEVAGGLADGVDQLLVLGVDWDLTPADAAGSIRRLSRAPRLHRRDVGDHPGHPDQRHARPAGPAARRPTTVSSRRWTPNAARPRTPSPGPPPTVSTAPSGCRSPTDDLLPSRSRRGRPVAGDRAPAGRRAVGEHPRVVPQRRPPAGGPRRQNAGAAGPRPRNTCSRAARSRRCASRDSPTACCRWSRGVRARPDPPGRDRPARRSWRKLRLFWEQAIPTVPRLGRTTDLDADLDGLLQTTPLTAGGPVPHRRSGRSP